MSKTKEELNALKKEVENVNEKLHELTPEELEQVIGGKGNQTGVMPIIFAQSIMKTSLLIDQ